MAFKSAKRRSGQSMSGATGRSNSGRVSQAGMQANARAVRAGPRGSGQLRVIQPIIGFSSVLATSFDVDLTYNGVEALPSNYFIVTTLNPKIPSPTQLVAGEDAAGDAGVDTATAAVAPPTDQEAQIGLTTALVYYVFAIVQDANLRFSTIASESQLTA